MWPVQWLCFILVPRESFGARNVSPVFLGLEPHQVPSWHKVIENFNGRWWSGCAIYGFSV